MNSSDRCRLRIVCNVCISLLVCFDPCKIQAQPQTVPHRESCTAWGAVRGQYGHPYFGTVNSCDEAVTVQLLFPGSPNVMKHDLKPQEVFNTGLTIEEAPDLYAFTTCPVGYVPSVPLVEKNWSTIIRSQYQCVKE